MCIIFARGFHLYQKSWTFPMDILDSLKMILFDPIWIHLVLGFQQSPFQISLEFKHDGMMNEQSQARAELGLWQLTPTKQESRPEIQNRVWFNSEPKYVMRKCASPLATVYSISHKWWKNLNAIWTYWKYFRWT